ncbi:immunoreactive protein [Thermoascus aurantiacus ATCC 26904]
MQFSHALVALVAAGLASAQLPDIPNCSLNCFVTALTSDGCSSLTDFACHCQKPQLISEVTPCVQQNCDLAAQSSVSSVVVSQCSAAGHPISLPAVGGGSTTAAATTSAAETTSTPAAASTTAVSTPAATTPSTPSAASSSTPAAGSSSAVSASKSTAAGTGGLKPTSSSGVSPPVFTGAAANVKGSMGGVAAVAAVAAYFL